MSDRAVLARGIHRLKDQQQCVRVLRVQHLLLLRQFGDAFLQQFGGLFLVLDRTCPVRVVVLEIDLLAGGDPQLIHQLSDFFHRCLTSFGPAPRYAGRWTTRKPNDDITKCHPHAHGTGAASAGFQGSIGLS
jgi:hypothetical protein